MQDRDGWQERELRPYQYDLMMNFGQSMNPLTLPPAAMGLIVSSVFFYKDGFGIR